jgi:hypothetical protein
MLFINFKDNISSCNNTMQTGWPTFNIFTIFTIILLYEGKILSILHLFFIWLTFI